ncbi:hypothetical protein RU08_19825 [Pseudomonas fulva]|uniref:Uncharacterized protein n=1 Tax=Pseudomonas fulva TaxID=47880 RepID=A0A0D0KET4_9PSED|nr:hypothetical protein RU08_19825 [Pseudomonas fulva]
MGDDPIFHLLNEQFYVRVAGIWFDRICKFGQFMHILKIRLIQHLAIACVAVVQRDSQGAQKVIDSDFDIAAFLAREAFFVASIDFFSTRRFRMPNVAACVIYIRAHGVARAGHHILLPLIDTHRLFAADPFGVIECFGNQLHPVKLSRTGTQPIAGHTQCIFVQPPAMRDMLRAIKLKYLIDRVEGGEPDTLVWIQHRIVYSRLASLEKAAPIFPFRFDEEFIFLLLPFSDSVPGLLSLGNPLFVVDLPKRQVVREGVAVFFVFLLPVLLGFGSPLCGIHRLTSSVLFNLFVKSGQFSGICH